MIIKLKLQKGDFVKIIAGNFKNIIGQISFITKDKTYITIDSLPIRQKYQKDNKFKKIHYLIHISNVMPWDKIAQMTSKIGYKLNLVTKKKERFFIKSKNFLQNYK